MSVRLEEEEGDTESDPSCLSLRSDWSKELPLNFRHEPGPSDTESDTSCLSLRSDWSKELPLNFRHEPGPSDTESDPSCLSLRRDRSEDLPLKFRHEPGPSDTEFQFSRLRAESPDPSCLSLRSDWSKDLPLVFRHEPGPSDTEERERSPDPVEDQPSCCAVCLDLLTDPVSVRCGHWFCRQCLTSYRDQSGSSGDSSCPQCEDNTRPISGPQKAGQTSSETTDRGLQRVLEEHKTSLRRRCERVSEGSEETGSRTLLNRIYTELYITEGQSEEVNTQHEVRQLETTSKKKTLQDTPIKCQDIFRALPGQQKPIRVVLTVGVAAQIKKNACIKKPLISNVMCPNYMYL
ncbi:uncharacterized protein LOC117829358 [Notolabrus celidotus]|uniref:uncharacterized protein LOC117829358 n=1 Tax=Notolabrus celidotus TaxID=1203425 RepID=UPI00148FC4E2|nr:uncharacterized protein LOC117829358 [Notolabrus celidotus]